MLNEILVELANKMVPYLRFTIGLFVLVNFLTGIGFNRTGIDNFDNFATGLAGLLALTFLLYCLLEGLQELRNKEIIQAKFFKVFGLIFEVILFVTGAYILTISRGLFSWWTTLIIFPTIGLLILITVDVRKIRVS